MNTVSIRCPHCGRELQVPEDAEQIVCMFCAKPIDFRLETQQNRDEPSGDCAEELAEAERLLNDDIFSFRIPMGDLTGAKYPPLFEQYENLLRPSLKCFRSAALLDEEAAVERMASLLFGGFHQQMEKKTGSRSFDCRFTITSLTIPAILEQKTPATEKMADRFLEKWKAEYPKQPLGKADYDSILKGFRKRLCFITTAVCRSLEKGDSCEELEAFRGFRDNWLALSDEGPEKICEYYLYAPMIVEAIDRSGQGQKEYRKIWEDHLLPCLGSLRAGENRCCAERYEDMMLELERKWLN